MKFSLQALLYLCLSPLVLHALPGYGAGSQAGEAGPETGEEVRSDPAVSLQPAQTSQLRQLPAKETFMGILERPLFQDDRRPSVETPEDQEMMSAIELTEQWSLTGVIVVGSYTRALLENEGEDLKLTLEAGMPLNDSWMLQAIEPDHVVMDRGDQQIRLELRTPRDTSPVAVTDSATEEPADSEPKDAQESQEAEPAKPRRLQQNTEASDE